MRGLPWSTGFSSNNWWFEVESICSSAVKTMIDSDCTSAATAKTVPLKSRLANVPIVAYIILYIYLLPDWTCLDMFKIKYHPFWRCRSASNGGRWLPKTGGFQKFPCSDVWEDGGLRQADYRFDGDRTHSTDDRQVSTSLPNLGALAQSRVENLEDMFMFLLHGMFSSCFSLVRVGEYFGTHQHYRRSAFCTQKFFNYWSHLWRVNLWDHLSSQDADI